MAKVILFSSANQETPVVMNFVFCSLVAALSSMPEAESTNCSPIASNRIAASSAEMCVKPFSILLILLFPKPTRRPSSSWVMPLFFRTAWIVLPRRLESEEGVNFVFIS